MAEALSPMVFSLDFGMTLYQRISHCVPALREIKGLKYREEPKLCRRPSNVQRIFNISSYFLKKKKKTTTGSQYKDALPLFPIFSAHTYWSRWMANDKWLQHTLSKGTLHCKVETLQTPFKQEETSNRTRLHVGGHLPHPVGVRGEKWGKEGREEGI